MAIGDKQKAQIVALKSQGLTQNDIADQLGISRSTVCRVLRYYNSPEETDLEDLELFRNQQRQFATDLASLANELIKITKEGVGSDEISTRDIGNLTKSITTLIDASSNAWTRATGLERTLNELEQIASERDSGFISGYTPTASTSAGQN